MNGELLEMDCAEDRTGVRYGAGGKGGNAFVGPRTEEEEGAAGDLLQIASLRRLRREKAKKYPLRRPHAIGRLYARPTDNKNTGEDTRKPERKGRRRSRSYQDGRGRPRERERGGRREGKESKTERGRVELFFDNSWSVVVIVVERGEVQAEMVGHEGLEGATTTDQVGVQALVLRQLEEALHVPQSTARESERGSVVTLERGKGTISGLGSGHLE
jgi:hypothetical protein